MMITERFDKVNGIRLHSLEAGTEHSEVILFLHGFPEYSGAWHQQLEFMAAQGYHAIAPDQRGYNLSSKPAGVKAYLINTLVEDIAELIKRLTTQKITLVGHDWGGGVAWRLARRYPQLLSRLIIINMPHLGVLKQTLKTSPMQMLKSWYTAYFQLPLLPELTARALNFKLLISSMAGTANKGTFSAPEIKGYKKAWQQPGALNRMINWYRAAKYDQETDGIITIPTLIIWGKNDKFLTLAMAQASIEKCTHGKLAMIEDATHWVYHEKPNEVNRLILEFAQDFQA
ncbi:epoxide hydrolase EphM [Mucilaginibacter koreensis]